MSTKKKEYKRWKQERTPEKIIAAFSSFFLYESAHLPQIIAWAKKALKNAKTEPTISKGSQFQRTFTRSVRPSIYRKMELINAALSVNDTDFMKMYEQFSSSDFKSREDVRGIVNYDDCLRVSAARVYSALKNKENIRKLLDEDIALKRNFHYIIDLIHGRNSYKETYEYRLKSLSPEARRRKALVTKICSELNFDELMAITEGLNTWPIIREMMAMNNIVLTDFWKIKVPKDDVARIVEVVFAFVDDDEEEDKVDSFANTLFHNIMGKPRSNDNPPPHKSQDTPSNNVLQKFQPPDNLVSDGLFDRDFLSRESNRSPVEDMSLLIKTIRDSIEESVNDHFDKAMDMVFEVAPYLVMYRFILLYKEARNFANNAYDETRDLTLQLNKEISVNKELFRKEIMRHERIKKMRDIELAERKQKQLNQLQLQYDRLMTQKLALESENKFLKDIIENENRDGSNDSDDTDVQTEAVNRNNNEDSEEIRFYPQGTILFGGHENWQRKFAKLHPGVKVLSGTENFPENVVSPRTPLVLLNSKHMSHSFFYKIRRLQQRQGWPIEYIT